MANDISGFGASVRLVASVTFPQGITLTQFADDSDPFDVPSNQIADSAMDVNGTLYKWSKANPPKVNIGLNPNTDDDNNLQILLEANRPAQGKNPASDVITLTCIYPDGSTATFSDGFITDGVPANGIASAGRLKSKVYSFSFQNLAFTKN